jgi:hypothetical protein
VIAKSRQNPSTLSLPVALSLTGGRLIARLSGNGSPPAAEVWVVGLAKSVTVAIKRGENKGKSVTYHNVARNWHKLTTTDGKTWSAPLQEIDGQGVNSAAVLVQSGTSERPGLILGAALASIH